MRALRNVALQLQIVFTAALVKSSESWIANTKEFAALGMILFTILFAIFDGLYVLKGED